MISRFYEAQPTKVLKAVLAGFERHFDDVSTDPVAARQKQPAEWYSNRMSVIRTILESRQLDDAAQVPTHKRARK